MCRRPTLVAVATVLVVILIGALAGCGAVPEQLPVDTATAGPAAEPTASPSTQPPSVAEASPTAVPAATAASEQSPNQGQITLTPTVKTDGVAAAGEVGPGGASESPEVTHTVPPSPVATPSPAGQPSKRVVVLDPGHGGPEIGAATENLLEKDVNLSIALKLATLLREEGYEVVLTRDTDRAVSPLYTGGGYGGGLTNDVQARVDTANETGADLFISIHNNGSNDPGESGTEVWYNNQRTFADRNLTLANLVQEALVRHIRNLGYQSVDRGIRDDTNFRIYRGRPYNIYVLGPGTGSRQHVPTQMPGVLGESLFLSNPGDAAMLGQESTLDAIAAGYLDAITAYFAQYPD
ncbi:MAG: N-acetylmuramoyl-L-alanine amidase family protein [Chloroflexota bacterium]